MYKYLCTIYSTTTKKVVDIGDVGVDTKYSGTSGKKSVGIKLTDWGHGATTCATKF